MAIIIILNHASGTTSQNLNIHKAVIGFIVKCLVTLTLPSVITGAFVNALTSTEPMATRT